MPDRSTGKRKVSCRRKAVTLKLLVIDEEFPYPLNTGKRIRTFALTKALTVHHDISYLAYGTSGSDSYRHLERNGIHCFAVPSPDRRQEGAGFYARLLGNLASSLPYIVTSHYTARFNKMLRELVSEHAFDLIICEWTPYAIYLKSLSGPKAIIVAHNIESHIWRRYLENERNPSKWAYIALQREKVEKFERSCFKWADGATAVCDSEADAIARLGVDYPVQTVENGVDLDYFHPIDAKIDHGTLVFSGSMDWRPNMDAVEYFVNEIFPLARASRPDLRFVVVGRKPPRHIRDLGRLDGVTVTGTVDDVRPFLASAALYVVPLRIGGGSRLKILEAMAMRKAVLSTTIGAEGLNLSPGENIIIRDEPEEFADAIIQYMDDTETSGRIAQQGRKLVERQYGWERLAEKLHRYITSVVQSR